MTICILASQVKHNNAYLARSCIQGFNLEDDVLRFFRSNFLCFSFTALQVAAFHKIEPGGVTGLLSGSRLGQDSYHTVNRWFTFLFLRPFFNCIYL
jgi:hypothetical protein